MSPENLAALRARLVAPVQWTPTDAESEAEYAAPICGLRCSVGFDAPGYWDAAVDLPDPIGRLYAQGTYRTREEAQAWCEAVARGIAAPWLQHLDALEQRVRELEASLAAEREMRAVLVDLQALAAVAHGDTAGAAELRRTAALIRGTKGAPTDGR